MIARERAIWAHSMLLSGGGKFSFFEEWGVSLKTVRAAWVGYEVTRGSLTYPCIAGGGFGVLCSKHVLVDLETLLQERVGTKSFWKLCGSGSSEPFKKVWLSPLRLACSVGDLLRKVLCQDRPAGRVPYMPRRGGGKPP